MSTKISLKTKIKFPNAVYYLLKLGDGRICISSINNIYILNKYTFAPEIKEENVHKKAINSLSQLEDGKLVSCADEPFLNIYNIEEKSLTIHQKIDVLSNIPIDLTKKFKYLFKATELINKELAICGFFPVLTFFEYNSLKELYDFKYYIYNKTDETIKYFKQINENQIILVTYKTYNSFHHMGFHTRIKLCDLEKKEIREKSIITHNGKFIGESMCKISENYLAIGVYKSILIIDLKKLKKIKEYDINNYFQNLCVFNNYLFCGSDEGIIYKYIINEDKIELKEKIDLGENSYINSLIKLNKKTMVFAQERNIFIYNFNEK